MIIRRGNLKYHLSRYISNIICYVFIIFLKGYRIYWCIYWMSLFLPLFGFIVTTSDPGSVWGVNWWPGPAPFLLSNFLIAASLSVFFVGTILQQIIGSKKLAIVVLTLISHFKGRNPWPVRFFKQKSPVARITTFRIKLNTPHNNITRITPGRHSFHAFIRIVAPFATFIETNIFTIE